MRGSATLTIPSSVALWTKSSGTALHGKQRLRVNPRDTAWKMSQENVDDFLEGVEALNRGDMERVLEGYAEEKAHLLEGGFFNQS